MDLALGNLLDPIPNPTAPVAGTFAELEQMKTLTALGGVQAQLSALMSSLSPYRPQRITDPSGRVFTMLAYDSGRTEIYVPPFQATLNTDPETGEPYITVQPGTIANSWEAMDGEVTVNGQDNPANDLVRITPPDTSQRLFAKITVAPVSAEVEEGLYEIQSFLTTEPWDIAFYPDSTEGQIPAIDPSTGFQTQAGIFYRSIARYYPAAGDEPASLVQFAYGPWEARQCHTRLTVLTGPVATITLAEEA